MKRIIQLVIVIGLILGFGLLIFFQMMGVFIHHKREIMVPDLRGQDLYKAFELLSEKALYLKKIGEEYDDDIPSGSIISQQPSPGTVVKKGKIVKVRLSSGGRVVFVPNLIGKTLRQAEIILHQSGLVIGEETWTYSNTVKKHCIVTHDPLPDEVIPKGGMVNLIISQGPTSFVEVPLMPNLLGKNIREVQRLLEDMDLGVNKVGSVVNDSVREGIVLKQKPQPNEIITDETMVALVISRKSRVEQVIRDETIYYEVSQGGSERNIRIEIEDDQGLRIVYEQSQKPGTKIKKDVKVLGRATVSIFVNDVLVEKKRLIPQ